MQQIAQAPADSHRLIDDIQFYVGVFRRGWKLIAIGVTVGLALAAIHLARSKTVYRASARLLLIQQAARPLGGAGGSDPFRGAEDASDSLATHLILMRSPVIVEQAIKFGGLEGTPPWAIAEGLTVKQPEPSAKIMEITYKSLSKQQAEKVVDGVIRSYNNFLRENFQKNTGDIIHLISKARDDLSTELTALEQKYLDYRQKNPAYSADDSGRSFVARRLDQWDQAMNQVLARSLQLKSQLELGRKLAGEGLDQETITGALNQLGGLGSNTVVAPLTAGPAQAGGGQSVERLREQIEEVESQRLGAELLLTHLRRELGRADGAISEREIAEAFQADPEVARLQEELRVKKSRVQSVQRTARQPNDASIAGIQRRIAELEEEIRRMWGRQRLTLAARLRDESNADISASVRKAEADVIQMKAKQAALAEQLERLSAKEEERLRRERQRLVRDRGEGHPQVRQVDQQIARIGRGGAEEDRKPGSERSAALLASIARSLEAIEATRLDLQAKFDEDLSASKKAEIGQLGEANMRSNLERHRTLFNSVVDQLKQAQLVSDFGSVSARTINPTQVSAEPPKYTNVVAMALLAGCGAGMLGAYLVELLDARVRSVAEMRQALGMPVLGIIPQLASDQAGPTGKVGLIGHEIPRSALAESYKSTRTNLEFLRRNRRAQVLLVTSPQPSEGKSTTASNLAIALSRAGRKVLLIDGDLRKPSQQAIYDMPAGRGFSDAIEGPGSIEDFARPTFVDNLDLLTTGTYAAHSAELLSSPRLAEVLDAVRGSYDVVIIDSSPLLAVTDPSILAAVADGILLVVRVGRTRRYDVKRTKDLLDSTGLLVLGVVINGITNNQMDYGYGYGGYGHGYGYGGHNTATLPDDPSVAASEQLVDMAIEVDARPLASVPKVGTNGRGGHPLIDPTHRIPGDHPTV